MRGLGQSWGGNYIQHQQIVYILGSIGAVAQLEERFDGIYLLTDFPVQ